MLGHSYRNMDIHWESTNISFNPRGVAALWVTDFLAVLNAHASAKTLMYPVSACSASPDRSSGFTYARQVYRISVRRDTFATLI